MDALGLSLFCVLGAQKTLEVGAHPTVAIIMGVISGTFGGIIRDVLGGEVSLVLRKETYFTAALAGAVVFIGWSATAEISFAGLAADFLCCFVVRALAIHYSWSLPAYKGREGRDV